MTYKFLMANSIGSCFFPNYEEQTVPSAYVNSYSCNTIPVINIYQ